MEMPLADLIDKLTITKLKLERLPQNETIIELFSIFKAEVDLALSKLPIDVRQNVEHKMEELYKQNGETWLLESEIRSGKIDREDMLTEIGRRTLKIRDSNKNRVNIKNEISLLIGQIEGIDIKIDHRSA